MTRLLFLSLFFLRLIHAAEPEAEHSKGLNLFGLGSDYSSTKTEREVIEPLPSDIEDETKWRGIACFGSGYCTYENLKTGAIHKFSKAHKIEEKKQSETPVANQILKRSNPNASVSADLASEKAYQIAKEEAKRLGIKTIVLKLGADDRCPPCRRLSATLKEMAKSTKDVAFLFADVDRANDIGDFFRKPDKGAMRFGGTIPQTYIITLDENDSWKIRDTFVGAQGPEFITNRMSAEQN